MKSVKLNVVMNLTRTLATLVFPLITFPYTSRILGPEGNGKTSFAFSLVNYFVLLASIGVPLYGIREVAKIRNNKAELSALVQELLILHGCASLVSFACFLGMIAISPKVHEEALLFWIVSCSIPLSMLTMEWLYNGLEEFVYITIRSVVFSAISVIALFLFVHHKGDYVVNAAITVMASLGSSVLNFWNARKIVFAKRNQAWNFHRHLKPIMLVYALNFVISLYAQLDTVMLGFMSSAVNVGYYSTAMRLTKMLLSLVSSMSSVLLPRLSFFLSNNMLKQFDEMLRKSIGVLILLCFPVTTGLILINRELLLLLAGPQYLPAVACSIITAPVILAIGLSGIFGYQILYSMHREKQFVLSVSIGAVLNISLNLILIPRFAHFGAAWGAVIAEAAILGSQIFMANRFYKVNWPWKNIAKCGFATIAMAIFLLAVHAMIPEHRLITRIFVDVFGGATVYFFILRWLDEEFSSEIITQLSTRFPLLRHLLFKRPSR